MGARSAAQFVTGGLLAVVLMIAWCLGTAASASNYDDPAFAYDSSDHIASDDIATVRVALKTPDTVGVEVGLMTESTHGRSGHPSELVAPTSAVDDVLRGVDDVLDDLPVGRQSSARTVASDAELQSTYDALTTGATPFERSGYPGTWMRRADDVEIGLRTASRSGGRTIDIRFPDGTTRKIHIE